MSDVTKKAEMAAEASESSSAETAAHIERAAKKNHDPEVAEELHDAAIAAGFLPLKINIAIEISVNSSQILPLARH